MREFQFYISAIITIGFCSEPCQDLPVSILHKCDYNRHVLVGAVLDSMFQFYISAIITKEQLDDDLLVRVSILHKCDYNLRMELNGVGLPRFNST